MIVKGSEWRKWDLHVHTKGTNKNDQYSCSCFDDFCKEMFSKAIENNISAIGITDYFSIDNYKKVIDYQKAIETNDEFSREDKDIIKNIFILPNVELRLLPVTDRGRLVNIHMLFNPVYVEELENDFFNELKYSSHSRTFPMNRAGLISLGKQVDPTSSTEDHAYKVGVNNFVVTHEALKTLLQRDAFRNNTIVVVSNSSQDGNSAYQHHYDLFENDADSSLDDIRSSIYHLSDCIFSGNQKDQIYFMGKGADDIEEIKRKCGSLKACIHGSDAHTEAKLFRPDNNRFCWIKADLTFEGLRQIIYEPERVRIQENNPENKSGYQVIESIKLDKQKVWQGEIGLSPYLNTIIGGRSTGKSTLLQCIARKISPMAEIDEHISDYINSLLDGISITWKDGAVDVSREIDFFTQNYMYNIASKPAELKKVIGNIIKEKDTEKNLEKYSTICNSINIQLSTFINQLIIIQQNIGLKNQELREKGDRSGIEHEIKSIEEKIEQIKAGATITKEEIDLYNKIVAQITEEESKIKTYQADLLQLRNLDKVSLFDTYYTNRLLLISEATRNNILQHYQDVVKDIDEQWQAYITGEIKQIEAFINAAQANILQKKADSIYIKGDAYFTSNQEYLGLQEKLEVERKKLALCIECKKQLDRLISDANSLKESIVLTHNKYKQECLKALEHLHYNGNGVDIIAKYVCRTNDLSSFLTTRHNVRSNANYEYVNNFISIYDSNDNSSVLNKYIDDCLSNKIEYKGGHISTNVLMELLTTNWYDIKYDLKYEKDPFEKMSPGKKAFVVLKLLLEFSDKQCPILIDQPEDSLDNRAIYNELVQYIRAKKESRQIILVTHNSNVVVSADAENVIVANQQGDDAGNNGDYQFQYINGPLENTRPKNNQCTIVLESQGIREHVCEIMEGGLEAFEKREQRYGLR